MTFTKRIVMMAGKGMSTNILYQALQQDFEIEKVILEDKVNKSAFLKKRVKHLGIWKVAGQVIFQATIPGILRSASKSRIASILHQAALTSDPPPQEKVIKVASVNDEHVVSILNRIKPDIVIVNGTRIISKKILESVKSCFINIHAGITPKYRNVHGAYWALVNNDQEHCGVTVHLVDQGIDTGNIIYQNTISITREDNFVTYPLLQLAAGIPLLKKALRDIAEDKLVTKKGTLQSKIWHHPTIGQYLFNRVVYGKK